MHVYAAMSMIDLIPSTSTSVHNWAAAVVAPRTAKKYMKADEIISPDTKRRKHASINGLSRYEEGMICV